MLSGAAGVLADDAPSSGASQAWERLLGTGGCLVGTSTATPDAKSACPADEMAGCWACGTVFSAASNATPTISATFFMDLSVPVDHPTSGGPPLLPARTSRP